MKHTRSSCLKGINLPRLPEVSKFSERRTPGNKPDDLGLKERILTLSPNIRERERNQHKGSALSFKLACFRYAVFGGGFHTYMMDKKHPSSRCKPDKPGVFLSRNRFGDKSEGAVLKGCGYGPNCFSTTGDPEASCRQDVASNCRAGTWLLFIWVRCQSQTMSNFQNW